MLIISKILKILLSGILLDPASRMYQLSIDQVPWRSANDCSKNLRSRMNDRSPIFLATGIFRLRFHNLGKGCLPASWEKEKTIPGSLYIRIKPFTYENTFPRFHKHPPYKGSGRIRSHHNRPSRNLRTTK